MGLAARAGLKIDAQMSELVELVELAAFQTARRRGLKMREITERFGVGMTKAARLSGDLKAHFLAPEREHGAGRQILSLLRAEPLSLKRLVRELDQDADAVAAAVERLVAEGRLRRVKGRTERFAPVRGVHRLPVAPWMARIDGLDTLMDHVFTAIEARFDRQDDQALVRNLAFRASPASLARLQALYEESLVPLIVALDKEAEADPDAVDVKLSVLWSPSRR